MSYTMETPTPMTASPESAELHHGFNKPTEANSSYFPSSQPQTPEDSPRGSISLSRPEEAVAPVAPRLHRSQTGSNPLPPFARDFPKPAEEIDVAKQLAMQPPKRSLHDSLRRWGTMERQQKVEDAETKARKFEEAKRELRALHSAKGW